MSKMLYHFPQNKADSLWREILKTYMWLTLNYDTYHLIKVKQFLLQFYMATMTLQVPCKNFRSHTRHVDVVTYFSNNTMSKRIIQQIKFLESGICSVSFFYERMGPSYLSGNIHVSIHIKLSLHNINIWSHK